ncbi:unnamed protein product [Prorocentrum cordatum]|uniref:Amino acid transporter transmembrane domain-containing protein n=1 Tax=Prorocentrum cordatum TaxID=2364126 RepID=A0ABN9QU89_9DINO|nr:unnamed protein product [Polarella glacialis]
MLGLCVLLYAVLMVIRDSVLHSPQEWGPDVVMFEWRMGAFEAIALNTHAFVAHYNAPKLFSELYRPSYRRWLAVVVLAYGTAFSVYSVFSYMGLRRFEGAVRGNILRNYGPDVAVLAAWFSPAGWWRRTTMTARWCSRTRLGMGFSIAFTYPLVFNSTREAAVNLFVAAREVSKSMPSIQLSQKKPWDARGTSQRAAIRQRSPSEVNMLGELSEDDDHPMPHKPGRRATVLLVFLTMIVGTMCEDVGIVNALAGSMMGVMICLVLPGLLFLSTARLQLQRVTGNSLAKPFLRGHSPAGTSLPAVPHGQRGRLALRLAVVAGAVTAVVGVIVSIIGTIVILASHSS